MSICDNWSDVIPFSLEPKPITLSRKLVITIFPFPQLDAELSAKLRLVTALSTLILIVEALVVLSAIVITPAFDWFLLTVKFNILLAST